MQTLRVTESADKEEMQTCKKRGTGSRRRRKAATERERSGAGRRGRRSGVEVASECRSSGRWSTGRRRTRENFPKNVAILTLNADLVI